MVENFVLRRQVEESVEEVYVQLKPHVAINIGGGA